MIGRNGLPLLQVVEHRPVRVMTHCNAGWLATVAHGTALAPIYVKSLAAGDRDSDLALPTPTSDGGDDADA